MTAIRRTKTHLSPSVFFFFFLFRLQRGRSQASASLWVCRPPPSAVTRFLLHVPVWSRTLVCVSALLLRSVTSAAGHKDKGWLPLLPPLSSSWWRFYYLRSAAGVLFDPLDDHLVHQLLGFSVEAVVGQVGHQVLLGDVQDLLLAGHLSTDGAVRRRKHTERRNANVSL